LKGVSRVKSQLPMPATVARATLSAGALVFATLVGIGVLGLRNVPSSDPPNRHPGAATASVAIVPSLAAIDVRRTPEEVTSIALALIERMEAQAEAIDPGHATKPQRVLTVESTTRGEAAKVEPNIGVPTEGTPEADRVVWVVRAEGTFVGDRVPPGKKPMIGTSGFIVIDDASGEIIGLGMP
jgi:hypothetical protein